MKISTFKNILLICTALVSFAPVLVFAQTPPPYTVLTPLPGTTVENSGNCTGANCTATLSTYLPGIFNLSIGIAAVMAFVLLTIYGFEYMLSDSLNVKTKAKEMLANVAFGGGLIIFAWLILNTINPALVSGGLNLTTPSITAPASVTAGIGGGYVGYINTCTDPTSALCASETDNRAYLAIDQGISVQSQCNGTKQSGCTNLANVTPDAIAGTIALQEECATSVSGGCPISITGGTEDQVGSALDMSPSAALNTYLTGSGTITTPPSSPITKQFTVNGQPMTVTFTYEATGQRSNLAGGGTVTATGNHWHVSFP